MCLSGSDSVQRISMFELFGSVVAILDFLFGDGLFDGFAQD